MTFIDSIRARVRQVAVVLGLVTVVLAGAAGIGCGTDEKSTSNTEDLWQSQGILTDEKSINNTEDLMNAISATVGDEWQSQPRGLGEDLTIPHAGGELEIMFSDDGQLTFVIWRDASGTQRLRVFVSTLFGGDEVHSYRFREDGSLWSKYYGRHSGVERYDCLGLLTSSPSPSPCS